MKLTMLHLLHIIRGFYGIIIINNAPTTQDLIESAPAEGKVMHMEEITATFTNYLKSKGLEYLESNKNTLMCYGVLTIISFIMDFLLFGTVILRMMQIEPVNLISLC